MRLWFALMIVLMGASAFPASAAGAAYRFATLDYPGAAHTFLYDLNERGAAVGDAYNEDFSFGRGVLYDGGDYESFVLDGADYTVLTSVNNAMTLTGHRLMDDGIDRAFLFAGGEREEVVANAEAAYTAAGINDRGDLAGTITEDFVTIQAFARIGEVTEIFSAPGTGVAVTQAFQISNRGAVVGWYRDGSGRSHGFVRDGDAFTTIDVPGAFLTRTFGINDRGDVAGYYQMVRGGPGTGFVWRDGEVLARLSAPDAVTTAVQGINNAGDVVGYYRDAGGVWHGFLAHRQGAR